MLTGIYPNLSHVSHLGNGSSSHTWHQQDPKNNLYILLIQSAPVCFSFYFLHISYSPCLVSPSSLHSPPSFMLSYTTEMPPNSSPCHQAANLLRHTKLYLQAFQTHQHEFLAPSLLQEPSQYGAQR